MPHLIAIYLMLTLNDHVVISLFPQLSSPSILPPRTSKGFHYLLGNDVLDKQ